jgi:hypothetical protein
MLSGKSRVVSRLFAQFKFTKFVGKISLHNLLSEQFRVCKLSKCDKSNSDSKLCDKSNSNSRDNIYYTYRFICIYKLDKVLCNVVNAETTKLTLLEAGRGRSFKIVVMTEIISLTKVKIVDREGVPLVNSVAESKIFDTNDEIGCTEAGKLLEANNVPNEEPSPSMTGRREANVLPALVLDNNDSTSETIGCTFPSNLVITPPTTGKDPNADSMEEII